MKSAPLYYVGWGVNEEAIEQKIGRVRPLEAELLHSFVRAPRYIAVFATDPAILSTQTGP